MFHMQTALFEDMLIESGLKSEDEYNADNQKEVGIAMCSMLEKLCMMPRMTNISESGFSQSWDFAKLGNFYQWLCKKWGVTPNKDVLAAMGVNSIVDRTRSW